jgi:hypothetical protein
LVIAESLIDDPGSPGPCDVGISGGDTELLEPRALEDPSGGDVGLRRHGLDAVEFELFKGNLADLRDRGIAFPFERAANAIWISSCCPLAVK